MDESELLALLGQLDARLTSGFDIVIVGGAAMYHLSRARPDWAQRMQYFLEEQGWSLD